MKKIIFIGLLLLLGAFINTTFAVEITCFGPKQFVRIEEEPVLSETDQELVDDAPTVYLDTFPGVPGEASIIVTNGGSGSKHRISSALIEINGDFVFTPNEFSQKVKENKKTFSIDKNNTIKIILNGKPETYLTITIDQIVEAEAASLIDNNGGVIEVTDSASPLKGTKLTFTDGATDGPTVVTIQEEDPIVTLPEEDYEIVSPGIKITSSKPLKKFAKVSIPFTNEILKPGFTLFGTNSGQSLAKDIAIIARYDETTERTTLVPTVHIDHLKKQLEFYTISFSVFTGIKLKGLPPGNQLNMDIYLSSVYPVLLQKIKNAEFMIDATAGSIEDQKRFLNSAVPLMQASLNGLTLQYNWQTISTEELNELMVDSLSEIVQMAYSSATPDELDPFLESLNCMAEGFIIHATTGKPAFNAISDACGVTTVKNAYLGLLSFFGGLWISNDIRQINENMIAIDYLKAYYYFGGGILNETIVKQKMAENIGLQEEPTNANIIKATAEPYKDGWFGQDDYNLNRVETLISDMKQLVLEKREELDPDMDYIAPGLDNCPNVSNPQQYDPNQNGIGDDCELIQSVSLTGCPGANISPTTMGWEFEVGPIPLRVTDLGFLNHRLLNPTPHYPAPDSHNVGIWSTDGTLLTSINVPEAAPLTGSFRFEPVAPTLLGAGMKYVIGADNDAVDPFCEAMGFSAYQFPFFKYLAVRMDKPDRSGLNFPAYSFTAERPRYFGPNFLFERLPCAIVTHNYLNSMYAIGVITIGNNVKYVGFYDGPNINFIADNQAWLSQMPNNGDVYTFRLCYDELCSNYEEVQYAVNGVNYNLPSIISPSGGQTVQTENFTITWEPSNSTPIAYYIAVVESGDRIWGALVDRLTTSIVYNYDGSAIEPLQPGKTYSLYVYAYDEKWNLASAGSVFYSN